ncbi:MAG: hypothetical protein JSV03_13080 [Planctomycetota bacterium]|nr:MAG: hypothetical protein JSV03_13080 [Planctomycetota bacterium]
MILADPTISYLGTVGIWWIPKPRGPRTSLWVALIAWLVWFLLLVATMLWLHASSRSLWPFGRQISSLAEILFRYELIVIVYLTYTTFLSLPVWIRCGRQARRDASAIETAIQQERWERAALLVHRYCLLVSGVWRRVPARVATWDGLIRKKLSRHRRLYVYFRDRAPEVPPDAAAGFTPAIIPPPHPTLLSAAALLVIAMLIYLLIIDIVEHGYWQRIVLFNAVLLLLILIGYGSYFLSSVLGRGYYFRFAPGVMQLVRFTLRRQQPTIETFNLREAHVVLDLCSPWPAMTLINTPGYRRQTFRLSKGTKVTEALMRAVLSASPCPPLPEDGLVE